jgi:hypothetical protein
LEFKTAEQKEEERRAAIGERRKRRKAAEQAQEDARNRDRLAALMEAGLRAVKDGAGWKGLWFTTKAHLDLARPGLIFRPDMEGCPQGRDPHPLFYS